VTHSSDGSVVFDGHAAPDMPWTPPRRIATPQIVPHESDLAGLWRYRVGAYRLVCRIEDDRLIVLVLAVGHRREVYR
jgi:mRNA-degrading endonuclease RelE of RelBE toxin-antitoxin system